MENHRTVESHRSQQTPRGLLKNFGQNYADTYTALQNRSKLIEQQAKELDEHEPNTNEEV